MTAPVVTTSIPAADLTAQRKARYAETLRVERDWHRDVVDEATRLANSAERRVELMLTQPTLCTPAERRAAELAARGFADELIRARAAHKAAFLAWVEATA